MSARTADQDARRKDGILQSFAVQQAEIIYDGVPVCLDASDKMLQSNDGTTITLGAGDIFVGISAEKCDNSLGADAAKECRVYRKGVFLLTFSDTLASTDKGKAVYVNNTSDDAVVTITSDAEAAIQVRIGTVLRIEDTTHAWVSIDNYVDSVAAAVPGA